MKQAWLIPLLFLIFTSTWALEGGLSWTGQVETNNCYNYALGTPRDSFTMPGEASGRPAEVMTCEDDFGRLGLVSASLNDGLRLVRTVQECRATEQVVALFNMPEMDFHWYRLEKNGIWTHKMGKKSPTDLDRSGKVITDVMKADRGQYRYFCGYFCVDYSKLKVRPQL